MRNINTVWWCLLLLPAMVSLKSRFCNLHFLGLVAHVYFLTQVFSCEHYWICFKFPLAPVIFMFCSCSCYFPTSRCKKRMLCKCFPKFTIECCFGVCGFLKVNKQTTQICMLILNEKNLYANVQIFCQFFGPRDFKSMNIDRLSYNLMPISM